MSLFRICCLLVTLVLSQTTILNAFDSTSLDQTANYARSAGSMLEGRPSDLISVIEITGSEPQEIADWVSSNIRYESYLGIRKGAKGTLISGSGNSADQAFLLASLFEYVGINAKLVSGTVAISELPQTIIPPLDDELSEMPSAEAMENFANKLGVNIEDLYDQMEGAQRARQTFLQSLWARTLHDLEYLSSKMEESGIPVPVPQHTSPDSVAHWWVQTQNGNYDTMLDSPPEDVNEEYSLSELPETLFHKVSVRMFIQRSEIEENEETKMDPESVLDITLNSAEVFGFPLAIGNIPLDIESQLNNLQNPTSEEVIDTFASASQFQPQLQSPRGLLTGRPFDKKGNKLQIKEGRIESVKKIGGSMGGLFGGGFGGASEEKIKSKLIANWIEIELTGPEDQSSSVEPVVIRRDLLKNPDTEKCSLELLTAREVLVHADELSGAWMSKKTLDYIADTAEFTAAMFTDASPEGTNAASLIELTTKSPTLNAELYSFGSARRNELNRLRDRIAPTARFVKGHPMVVSYVRGFSSNNEGLRARNGIDILHQAFQVENYEAKSWSNSLTFAAGVLDTALELAIVQEMHPTKLISNSSVALAEAIDSGAKTEVVSLNGSIQFQISSVSTNAIVAHYEIDPTTGMSLGMMDGGGQAMTEYAEYTNIVLQLKSAIQFYADIMRCMAMGITSPLRGGGVEERLALAECFAKIACGKVTSVVGMFKSSEVNWTNMLIKKQVTQAFNGVCKKAAAQAFG